MPGQTSELHLLCNPTLYSTSPLATASCVFLFTSVNQHTVLGLLVTREVIRKLFPITAMYSQGCFVTVISCPH